MDIAKSTSRNETILVYRLGSLGDMCIAVPALRLIRQHHQNAHIVLLTNLPVSIKAAPAVALLEGSGLVDEYLSYPVGTRNPLVVAQLWAQLAKRGFALVINLAAWRGRNQTWRDSMFFRLAGISRQLGFENAEPPMAAAASSGLVESEASRLCRRVEAYGRADLDLPIWRSLGLSPAETKAAADRLGASGLTPPFIAISIGAKVSAKDWTQPNWIRLTEGLSALFPHFGCVAIGSVDERARADECLHKWRGPSLNLCGESSPRESAAILHHAAVFVGHDSGPMHLAAAAGIRCVAIFAARRPPGQWFPLGRGHRVLYHKTECFNCGLDVCVENQKKCILSITVDEAMSALEEVLVAA